MVTEYGQGFVDYSVATGKRDTASCVYYFLNIYYYNALKVATNSILSYILNDEREVTPESSTTIEGYFLYLQGLSESSRVQWEQSRMS